MRLKNYLYLLIILLIQSCTDRNPDDETLKKFINRISNQSDFTFSFIVEDISGDIIFDEFIKPNEYLDFCEYFAINYNGVGCSDFGIIKIIFNDNRGYICDYTSINNMCIPSKNLVEDKVGTNNGNNIYIITINNVDYEQAFEL